MLILTRGEYRKMCDFFFKISYVRKKIKIYTNRQSGGSILGDEMGA